MPESLSIAILTTAWFTNSHADVIIPMIVEGWDINGSRQATTMRIAAVYLEQTETSRGADVGVDYLRAHGIRRAATPADALLDDSAGLAVDGVLIIGEHGDYEHNEFGQHLYPRRRLFEAALAAMAKADTFVPIFNDKGLSYCADDAFALLESTRQVGVAVGAGSTAPLSWRIPRAAEWPRGARMTSAVAVAWGPRESYGFHALEALQSWAERRDGYESGVATVRAHEAASARAALTSGAIDHALVEAALAYAGAPRLAGALSQVEGAIQIDYLDGLSAWVLQLGTAASAFSVACKGPDQSSGCTFWLDNDRFTHFGFLVKQAELLFTNGAPATPIERTLLTTAVLDAAMRSWATNAPVSWPELAVRYTATENYTGTGIQLPLPTPAA